MTVRVVGAAVMDPRGLIGSGGLTVELDPLGVLRWKQAFASPFPTFRRLDRLSKLALLTAEAAGVGDLSAETKTETAVVLGSVYGCLEADLAFAESLRPERDTRPALFPYTLPSTCLGEIAVRYGLQGPSLCLSTLEGAEASALTEATALIEGGEASAACVCLGDALPPAVAAVAGVAERALFVAVVLATAGPAVLDLDRVRSAPSPLSFVAERLWETRAK
jgi:hypothetical protein